MQCYQQNRIRHVCRFCYTQNWIGRKLSYNPHSPARRNRAHRIDQYHQSRRQKHDRPVNCCDRHNRKGLTCVAVAGTFQRPAAQPRGLRRAANGNSSRAEKVQAGSAGIRTSMKRLSHRRLRCVCGILHLVVGPRREQVCNLRMFGHFQRTITFNVGEVGQQHWLPHAAFAC